MSAEQIKSILNGEFMALPNKFDPNHGQGEPSAEVEKLIGVSAKDAFSTQAKLDHARRDLSRAQFRVLIALYFSSFISIEGFDVRAFEKELKAKREMFRRHLGRDWVYFLTTLTRVYSEVDNKKEQRPQGLLQVVK